MATQLSQSVALVKKAIIFFIIGAILIIVLDSVLKVLFPETPPPSGTGINKSAYVKADNSFGKIPKPKLKTLTLSANTKASFSLKGNLPEVPPTVNLYQISKPQEKFGYVDRARVIAKKLGFSSQEQRLTNDVLYWFTQNNSRTLQYDKVLQMWLFNVDLTRDAALKTPKKISTTTDFYKNMGIQVFSQLGLSNSFISSAHSRVDYMTLDANGKLISVILPEKAKFVRIAQYKNIESSSLRDTYKPGPTETPALKVDSNIRTTNYMDGPAVILLQGTLSKINEDLVNFKYKDYSFSSTNGVINKAVYNLMTPVQAWDAIQNNQGVLYYMKPQNKDILDPYTETSVSEFTVDTSKISIIYLEPDNWLESEPWTHFLQPFYLFEGLAQLPDGTRADFAFLLPALNSTDYLE